VLLFRLLAGARLGEREALGLLAARGAFFYVISALAVSHKTFILTFSRPIPSDFAKIRRLKGTRYELAGLRPAIAWLGLIGCPPQN